MLAFRETRRCGSVFPGYYCLMANLEPLAGSLIELEEAPGKMFGIAAVRALFVVAVLLIGNKAGEVVADGAISAGIM